MDFVFCFPIYEDGFLGFLATASATSRVLLFVWFRLIVEMSLSKQRDSEDGMEQPKKSDKILITISQYCFIGVQCQSAWIYVSLQFWVQCGQMCQVKPIWNNFRPVRWVLWIVLYCISCRLEFFADLSPEISVNR